MRKMHWSWYDYLSLPMLHREVLIEMMQDEAEQQRRDERVARIKAMQRGR